VEQIVARKMGRRLGVESLQHHRLAIECRPRC
jgi:hypothetical protein